LAAQLIMFAVPRVGSMRRQDRWSGKLSFLKFKVPAKFLSGQSSLKWGRKTGKTFRDGFLQNGRKKKKAALPAQIVQAGGGEVGKKKKRKK